MKRPMIVAVLLSLGLGGGLPMLAAAQPLTFKLLPRYSTATFKTDALLETIVGTTPPEGLDGTLTLDPARPQAAVGTVRVNLAMVRTGIEKRDADMRSRQYLDTEDPANRHAVFEITSVAIAGPLEPGKEAPAKVRGVLTVKQTPVDLVADARVTYVRLTSEQLESQRRWGFTADNIKVRARFGTTFTNHGMQVPQFLAFKVSNDIQLETDLIFVRDQP